LDTETLLEGIQSNAKIYNAYMSAAGTKHKELDNSAILVEHARIISDTMRSYES